MINKALIPNENNLNLKEKKFRLFKGSGLFLSKLRDE